MLKFVGGVCNWKRKQVVIYGNMVDGKWVTNPKSVKAKFYNYFGTKFGVNVMVKPIQESTQKKSNGHLSFIEALIYEG